MDEKEILLLHFGNLVQCLKLAVIELALMLIDEGTKLLIESRVGWILAIVLIDERWVEDYVCSWEELAAFNGPELSNRSDKAIIKIDVHFQQIIKKDPQSYIVLVQDSIDLYINVGGILLPLS